MPAPIQIPIGAENELEGMVDLITMQEWVWAGEDLGATWELRPIRESCRTLPDEWRAKLIETAVEMDDDAMEAYLEGEEPDEATLRALDPQGHARNYSFLFCVVRPSRTKVFSRF